MDAADQPAYPTHNPSFPETRISLPRDEQRPSPPRQTAAAQQRPSRRNSRRRAVGGLAAVAHGDAGLPWPGPVAVEEAEVHALVRAHPRHPRRSERRRGYFRRRCCGSGSGSDGRSGGGEAGGPFAEEGRGREALRTPAARPVCQGPGPACGDSVLVFVFLVWRARKLAAAKCACRNLPSRATAQQWWRSLHHVSWPCSTVRARRHRHAAWSRVTAGSTLSPGLRKVPCAMSDGDAKRIDVLCTCGPTPLRPPSHPHPPRPQEATLHDTVPARSKCHYGVLSPTRAVKAPGRLR